MEVELTTDDGGYVWIGGHTKIPVSEFEDMAGVPVQDRTGDEPREIGVVESTEYHDGELHVTLELMDR